MFGSLTSFTGGGGLDTSSSSQAGGDNTFANGFNYKAGGGNGNNQTLILAGLAAVALAVFVMRGK